MRLLNRVINPVVRGVLRSPAHRLASGSLLLIEMAGCRSGRQLSVPVAYRWTGPSELRVQVGGWQHKQWWRNLRESRQVTVWLRGDRLPATGLAHRDDGAVEVVLRLNRA